ncbi:unnamed protein product [Staurois parvus]|uniref:Uncharacterized protein n=1 Tax=Staurois parvus TaxID=386267 RepID=A0ABN9ABX8_9NEOB|nr:unnamed protein product [Staurois parvus]
MKVIAFINGGIYTGIFLFCIFTSNGSDQQLIAGLRGCDRHSDTRGTDLVSLTSPVTPIQRSVL